MLALNLDSRFELEEDILLQALPDLDHYYAFNTKDGDNFKLNHTAHWVLAAIGSGINYSELLDGFSKEFDSDVKTTEEDLKEVFQYALENKIIKEVKP
ncbi:MAG: PqqD family peptide modification chaperone [Pseudomonadota bacterium]